MHACSPPLLILPKQKSHHNASLFAHESAAKIDLRVGRGIASFYAGQPDVLTPLILLLIALLAERAI